MGFWKGKTKQVKGFIMRCRRQDVIMFIILVYCRAGFREGGLSGVSAVRIGMEGP